METTADFDVVVVGTGFASSFFLAGYLQKARASERILVLERGFLDSHAWQIENQRTSRIDSEDTFVNKTPNKPWTFSLGFGGGSNCWWANAPRMLPSDFELHSRYGVGTDWPLTYNDLEPHYAQAEEIMAISGPSDGSPYPRSGPYPQPPHRLSDPAILLKQGFPNAFFAMPTGRARVATANRGKCCASGICNLCPVNAKFTVLSEMKDIYADERVVLELGAAVQTVETTGGIARGVTYKQDGALKSARADLVVLGANALFNPHILLRSGLRHPALGRGLNEQVSVIVLVDLAGVDNYQGSTSIVGAGYMDYDGPHRAVRAASLIEVHNVPHVPEALRLARGRWRQRLLLEFLFEDLPSERNFVAVDARNPELPQTVYNGYSEYTQRSINALPDLLPKLLAPLPVERFKVDPPSKDEAHIQGTTAMGNDPETSIVDRNLVHHQVRNLLVLGSSAFPTCPPAHPTLTLSALSLWAASNL